MPRGVEERPEAHGPRNCGGRCECGRAASRSQRGGAAEETDAALKVARLNYPASSLRS